MFRFFTQTLKGNTVIFDIGNVILDITYEDITLKATGNLTKLELYTQIFKSDTWTKDACLGLYDEITIAQKLAQEFNLPIEEILQLREATRNSFTVNEECVALIKDLYQQNCQLLVISNMPKLTYDSFKHYEFWKYFTKIYISAEVQMIKPEKFIYAHVVEDSQLDPTLTWFIDDSIDNLVEASKLGMKVCHFTTTQDCREKLIKNLTYSNNIHKEKHHQNAIALSFLNYIIQNEDIKKLIQKFGSGLAEKILQPLIKIVETTPLEEQLPSSAQNMIAHLLLNHTSKARQYDGLKIERPIEDFNSRAEQLTLLLEIEHLLCKRSVWDSYQILANYFKCMYDISTMFVREYLKQGDKEFRQLDTIIMPTFDECNNRISFSEIDKNKFATTFGLSAKHGDLIDESYVSKNTPVSEARITGKSLFEEISTSRRYLLVFIAYLEAQENYHMLKNNEKDHEEIEKAEQVLLKWIQEMINLNIPLEFSETDIDKVVAIAEVNKTWLEKISTQTETPLVGSVSGNMGRLLMSLIHFKLINISSNHSIDELQILSNCAAAHMALQGHHTFEEVHEAARRGIDALLLMNTSKNQSACALNHDFYKVGLKIFLHASYAEKVTEQALKNLEIAEEMPHYYHDLK